MKETRGHAHHEAANHVTTSATHHDALTTGEIFRLTSFRDKALSSCSQAGLVNNLNDGLAWGLFPLAAIGDVAHPTWRARSVGIYRLWRDGGFAVGALLAGILADLASIETAIYAVAALTALSGVVVIVRIHETHPPTARPAPITGPI